MLNVLGGVAQFKREMMLEREHEGIARAKAEGAYKGRETYRTLRGRGDQGAGG
jgi:DNA invertase Pin-like site-specific DNA recombinase